MRTRLTSFLELPLLFTRFEVIMATTFQHKRTYVILAVGMKPTLNTPTIKKKKTRNCVE